MRSGRADLVAPSDPERAVVGPAAAPLPPDRAAVPDDWFGPVRRTDDDRDVDLDLLHFPEWPKAGPTPSLDFDDWLLEPDESRKTKPTPSLDFDDWLSESEESWKAKVIAQPLISDAAPDPGPSATLRGRHRRRLLAGFGGIAVIWVFAGGSDSISFPFDSGIASASAAPVSPSFDDAPGRIVPPEATPASRTTPAPLVTPVPRTTPDLRVVGPRAPYSIALAAYRDRSLAVAHRDALATAAPGHLFILAPVLVNGQLFHRVLGGLAGGREEIGLVVQEISTATGEPSSPWLVRETRLAYTIDEMAERAAADRRVADLRDLGIPAYALSVQYSDESITHRVLAGAYGTASEAEYLGRLLLDHDLGSAKLEPRVGIFGY